MNAPELTAERFIDTVEQVSLFPTRIYKTGDLARWLLDGNIEFLGRIDHQVKIRGFRIELGEIESRLRNHPMVSEVIVTVVGEQNSNLCAYIVLNNNADGESFSPEDMREYLSGKLPHFMIPSHVVQIERIPLTSNGKVDRKALPEPEVKSSAEYAAPRSDMEREISQIWRQVLGLESVGINDNFFDVGGNSLKIMKLSAELKRRLGIEAPTAKLFQYPSVASFTRYIENENSAGIGPAREKDEAVEFEPAKVNDRLKQRRERRKS